MIVDGAAFGNEIEQVIDTIKYLSTKGVEVYLDASDSFEYLCLNTSVFINKAKNWLVERLKRTYDFIDYTKYKSTEVYYEELLRYMMIKSNFGSYNKAGNIPKIFKTDRFLSEIRMQLKDLI